jgi:UPF0716 family protein affecting phage T7 exclusion
MAAQGPPQPTELVYLPRPSWAPAALAFGLGFFIAGIYAKGFLLPGFVYSTIGAAIALASLRQLAVGAARDVMRLPRRQRIRSAVVPPSTFEAPRKG